MSMVKCPKCGHNISSMVKACPECNCPLQQGKPSASSQSDTPVSLKRSITWGMVVGLGFLILVTGYFYLGVRTAQQREARAYTLLKECKDPLLFEDFIAKYPDSKHLEEVRRHYLSLSKEQAEWETMVLKGNRDELSAFMSANPGSPYLRVVRARIDSMDWQEACARLTIQSMEQYIAAHPDGIFIEQADLQRQRLERERLAAEERARQDTLTASADSLAV